MTVVKFDPELWLETTIRGIQSYVEDALSGTLGEAYRVVMEFPGPELDREKVPMVKTVIHFEVDAMEDSRVGMGEIVGNYNYNDTTKTVNPQSAEMHVLNFDVGIWASAKSGGTTSRMRVRQLLTTLFGSPQARQQFREATDDGDGGVEIRQFTGGRFVNDTIADVPVYRMVGGELEVRVFSRTPLATPSPAIGEVIQESDLTVQA